MIDPISAVRLAKSQRDLLINATTNNYLPSGGKDLVKIAE
ncbi:hypothetical protein PMIT1306_02487 [Prochlorococcus sp. MIT 1306]|nr:hypothetical protein PMIT1306_02487 [Prochlorococcus sp. MIT 1306]